MLSPSSARLADSVSMENNTKNKKLEVPQQQQQQQQQPLSPIPLYHRGRTSSVKTRDAVAETAATDENATDENEEVLRLAAALAPALDAADELLQVPIREFQTSVNEDENVDDEILEDDDDLDDEVEGLGASEDLLRQELELAQDFSRFFSFSTTLTSNDSHDDDNDQNGHDDTNNNSCTHDEPVTLLTGVEQEEDEFSSSFSRRQCSSHSEADLDDDGNIQNEEEQVVFDKELQPIAIPSKISTETNKTFTKSSDFYPSEDSLFAPFRKRGGGSVVIHYTASEHSRMLSLVKEEHGGWYSIRLAKHLVGTLNEKDDDAVKEYCLAMPDVKLRQLYVGIPDPPAAPKPPPTIAERAMTGSITATTLTTKAKTTSTTASTVTGALPTPLPVRTIAVRIRPDVLCGAVMEAFHHALTELHAQITKRQGGHCQAIVKMGEQQQQQQHHTTLTTTTDIEPTATMPHQSNMIWHPPFFVDARLVTYKSDNCERVLLLRVYHIINLDKTRVYAGTTIVDNAEDDDSGEVASSTLPEITIYEDTDHPAAIGLHLREAAALIQHMEAPAAAKRINPRGGIASLERNLTRQAVEEAVSAHLQEQYRACPSVKEGGITLPALNADDFSVIQSSWRLIKSVWEELETRDLAYTTLRTSRFGSFPSLPTLDVHYCAQIRRIAREAMTAQLIKSAFELEQYAREAELACANMITLLKPTFEAYGVDAPSLPKPKQLTEYPLDFVVPQASCPPWGVKVQHALNEIQAWTGDANKNGPSEPLVHTIVDAPKSLEMAIAAVQLVLEAFHKQDDEEQSARLGRKNIQIMDRLAKMQSHEELSIRTLENCTNLSETAAMAASNFYAKSGIREVPLLKWGIVVGRSTGTCTITANHILFVTQLIPVVGGSKKTLYNLKDVDFNFVDEATPSLLNPLPTVVNVIQCGEGGSVVFTFRPSMGGARLKSFLDVVKTAAMRNSLKVPTQEQDNNVDVPASGAV